MRMLHSSNCTEATQLWVGNVRRKRWLHASRGRLLCEVMQQTDQYLGPYV